MTIQIVRGLRGDQSSSIAFVGVSSDKISSAKYLHEANAITARVGVNDAVDIVDDRLSTNNGGGTTYDLHGVHYSEYRDLDGNTFSSAVGVVSYIEALQVGIATAMYLRRSLPLTIAGDTFNVTANVEFTYDATKTRGVSYFWDGSTFPNGVSVSVYDRRKLTGIITETGSYNISYEVANGLGTVQTSVEIIVS